MAHPSGQETAGRPGKWLRPGLCAALGLLMCSATGCREPKKARPVSREEPKAPVQGAPANGKKPPLPGPPQVESRATDVTQPSLPEPPPAQDRAAKAPPEAFSIPADRPLRISWPLDLGPDPSGRPCLRARQGVNELQNPGEGNSLYAFRVARAGKYRTFLRVRWLDDGVGSVDCNNSWFARLNDGRCVVVGNRNERRDWHWEKGPSSRLDAGVHWFRVELREDGVFMDRIAVLPGDADASRERLDGLPVVEFAGFGGLRPPDDPAHPIREVEINALPTRSLVIGRGHVNEITVLASYQGKSGGFRGKAHVTPLTGPGTAFIACAADSPHARALVRIEFPSRCERRIHRVAVDVVREEPGGGECVFRETIRLVKPPAWAFLGPFRDPSRGRAGLALREGRTTLEGLAKRAPVQNLFAKALTAAGWKLVEDGSCYDELGAVDLFKVYGRTVNAYSYAVTWLRAERHLNHRSFLFQADDTASLWVNGRLTALVPVKLPKEANRLWSSAALAPRLNPVVVKIAQGGRYWGFRLDVIDWHWQGRRGDVIRWAEPAAWPGAE